MNDYIMLYAILIVVGLFGTYAVIPLFRNLLIESNVLRPNYKKHFPRTAGKVKIIKEMLNSLIEFYNSFNV